MRNPQPHSFLPFLVFSILIFVYLLTFSGFYSTDDEQLYGSLTATMAGGRGYSAYQLFGNDRLQGESNNVEPLHPILGIPFFMLADKIGVGKIQILFLLPALYNALTGGILVLIALKKGYSSKTACLLGFTFGLGTIAFPYARTNFREPLAALFVSASVFFLTAFEKENGKPVKNILYPVFGLVMLALAVFTKITTGVLIPFLITYYFLEKKSFLKRIKPKRIFFILLLFSLLALAAYFIASRLPTSSINRFTLQFFNYIRFTLPRIPHDHFWSGLAGLIISPGKGLLIYSPILFLILVSPFVKPKQLSDWFLFGGALLSLAAVQAFIYDDQWWSITWGTRSLVPVLPLACLAALPALDAGLHNSKKWIRVSLFILLALSGVIQFGRLVTSDPVYLNWAVQFTGRSISEAAQWDLSLMPLFRHWLLAAGHQSSEIAWLYINTPNPFLVLIVISLTGITLSVFNLLNNRKAKRGRIVVVSALVIASLILTPFAAQFDQRYNRDVLSFKGTSEFICESAQSADLVFLDAYLDPLWWFYANFGCDNSGWVGLAALTQTSVNKDQFFPRFDVLQNIAKGTISQGQKVFLIQPSRPQPLSYSEEFKNSGFHVDPVYGSSSPDITIFQISDIN